MASAVHEPAGEAIPKLLEQHGGQIYALGLRLCGGPEAAEDLVQQTFLNAFRRWDGFEGRSEPSTWLYSIAVRACRRQKRRRAGEPARIESLEELLPHEGDAVPALSSGDGPLDEQMRREAREIIERGLTRLPLEFRLPLVLKDIAGFSLAQAAEVLGLREETVKTRVHRARLKLRKEIEEGLPGEPAVLHASTQVCLDLLRAKLEALDRGVEFPLPGDEICSRCESLFAALDLEKDVCVDLRQGQLPPRLRAALLAEMGLRADREAGRRG